MKMITGRTTTADQSLFTMGFFSRISTPVVTSNLGPGPYLLTIFSEVRIQQNNLLGQDDFRSA